MLHEKGLPEPRSARFWRAPSLLVDYVLPVRSLVSIPLALVALSLSGIAAGCSSEDGTGPAQVAPHDDDEPTVGEVSSALVDSDPVSKAVTDSCTTASVKGLGAQLVGEIQCLRPGTMARIDGIPNTTLGSAVFPYLQAPAATSLRAVAATRNVRLVVNSALRTLPQQYLLYRWYQTRRCGISLAASPGRSNHESGVAVDVNDNAGWRAGFQGKGWRWLGASDPVHYDYTAGGVSLNGLSVRAFQRLWNRNNPTDRIAEDGAYGPATEQRLARAPVGGFRLGPSCPDGGTIADAGTRADGSTDGGPLDEPPLDLPEGPNTPEEIPDAPEPDAIPEGQGLDPIAQEGCNAGNAGAGSASAGIAVLGVAIAAAWRRRRAR